MKESKSIHIAVYTEDVGDIAALTADSLQGIPFTVEHTEGIWAGIREKSAVIHVIVEEPISDFVTDKLDKLVTRLKEENKQETVLVESWRVRMILR